MTSGRHILALLILSLTTAHLINCTETGNWSNAGDSAQVRFDKKLSSAFKGHQRNIELPEDDWLKPAENPLVLDSVLKDDGTRWYREIYKLVIKISNADQHLRESKWRLSRGLRTLDRALKDLRNTRLNVLENLRDLNISLLNASNAGEEMLNTASELAASSTNKSPSRLEIQERTTSEFVALQKKIELTLSGLSGLFDTNALSEMEVVGYRSRRVKRMQDEQSDALSMWKRLVELERIVAHLDQEQRSQREQVHRIRTVHVHMRESLEGIESARGLRSKEGVTGSETWGQQLALLRRRLEDLPVVCRWGKKFRLSCYDVTTARRTFRGAERYCARRNGTLAVVKDLETQRFLERYIQRVEDTSHWIGLDDRDNEGQFKWHDGTLLQHGWKFFYEGEPRGDTHDENCVHMTMAKYGHRWNDLACSSKLPFICQY
uniref:C-type lectin domain family 4 member F-like n=1 Tax=Myxine glutinosa TaxID=7769 RepID=UPI00358F612D